jgi:hypothetical protein
MSYLAAVSELNPLVYFSFSVVDDMDAPVDLQGTVELDFSGEYFYADPKLNFNRFLALEESNYCSIKSRNEFHQSPTSIVFWVDNLNTDSGIKQLFSWRGGTRWVEISFDPLQSSIILDTSSGGQSQLLVQDTDIKFIAIIFNGTNVLVFYNGQQLYSSAQLAPSNNQISLIFGSLSSLQALGDKKFAEIAIFNYALNASQVKSLYDVGAFGAEKIKIISGSLLSFSDGVKSFLQTSWQAYGDIFTQR